MAPLIGGFVNSRAGWRWNLITTAILVTVSWLLILVGVDESYAPVLLARKNKHMARHDGPSLATRYRNAIVTPFKLLFTEPVLALVSFYLSFLYAVFYALFPVSGAS
jgi:DHA1 family multidrug resistance protein-like MFS transporter